ncbi:MAG: PIN domain-containing protein [Methanosarcinales archaeon]
MDSIVLDTTAIVKGLVTPRRKKNDEIREAALKIHNIALNLLKKVESKLCNLFIPSAALVETGSVISRLTGDEVIAQNSVNFMKNISNILYDSQTLEYAISVGIKTKASGFDSLFIASAAFTNSTLITDDKKMYEHAKKFGVKAKLLRDMI